MKNLSPEQQSVVLKFQKAEITEYYLYLKLASVRLEANNSELLTKIAKEEKQHYEFFKNISGVDTNPNIFLINWFYFIARIFGLSFGIRLMERGEENAQNLYKSIVEVVPEINKIIEDEHRHECELIDLIQEERLEYIGSVVLGLNDALVELTGALAGFSLAMQNNKLIGFAGLITGIAASFSMSASNYLSKKADGDGLTAVKSAFYTGSAYMATVILLILPYWFFSNYFLSLSLTLIIAILIILIFNYYISVAKSLEFKRRFIEMAAISLGVSAITFFIGWAVRKFFGITF